MKANKLSKESNLRWTSSRMMLHEHVAALRARRCNMEKIERPHLDDQELDLLNRKLRMAAGSDHLMAFFYYKNGLIERRAGYLYRIDLLNRQLYIHDASGIPWQIKLDDLMDIRAYSGDIQL